MRNPELLSPREIEVLSLRSQGLSPIEVSQKLGISLRTAKAHQKNASYKLIPYDDGPRMNIAHVAFRGLETGIIKSEDIIQNLSPEQLKALESLTPKQREVLDVTVKTNGEKNTTKDIAAELFISPFTAKFHLTTIKQKLKMKFVRSVLTWYLYKQGKITLNNNLDEDSPESPANFQKTLRALFTDDNIAPLKKLLALGILDTDTVLNTLGLNQENILSLTEKEIQTLAVIARNGIATDTNREIAQALHISTGALAYRLRTILSKLSLKNKRELAFFYMAARDALKEKDDK